jgi:hypothetical protein
MVNSGGQSRVSRFCRAGTRLVARLRAEAVRRAPFRAETELRVSEPMRGLETAAGKPGRNAGEGTGEGNTDTPQPPREDDRDRPGRNQDDIPDTPPTEPPPVPVEEPPASRREGPFVVCQ